MTPVHRPTPRTATARAAHAAALLRALLCALLCALTPAVAWAHGALRKAVPARGARLTTAPREIRLTFSERAELAVTRVQLRGPGQAAVALAPLTSPPDSGQVVVAVVRGPLGAGAYTVAWQVVGRDGHPVRGRYTFTIAEGAAGLAAAPTPAGGETGASTTSPPDAPTGQRLTAPAAPPPPPPAAGFGAESPAYVAVRALTYLALMLVVGAVAFRLAVLGPLRRALRPGAAAGDDAFVARAAGRAAGWGLWGAVGLVAVALARLSAQQHALFGGAEGTASAGAMLRGTVWGRGWLLQVAAAALAALGFAVARRTPAAGPGGDGGRAGWGLAAVAGLALAVTPALSGHAAAAPRYAPLVVAADALHVLGAAGWLGGLLLVLVAGLPAARAADAASGAEGRGRAAALVHAFSPAALGFAGLLTATGLVAAWVHVGSLPALWQTGYGRTLLLKLALFALAAAAGAYNWRRVRPSLDGADDGGAGVARLRRSGGVELAAAVAVLAVTAVLVATPAPADAAASAPGPAGGAARQAQAR